MCNKTVDNYRNAWECVPERYKTQKACDAAANIYPFTIKLIPEYFVTQKCKIKQLIDVFLYIILFLINIKYKKICYKVLSEDPFLVLYCPDKYEIQGMCDEAVDDSITILKPVSDWFVTYNMIKKLYTTFYADENILYFNEDLVILYFLVMKWVFLI